MLPWCLVLLGVLPACFIGRNSENEPIREVDISALQPGKTTKLKPCQPMGM